MTERPILFSAEMVRAIFAGRKKQTRRKMKVQPYPDSIVTVEHFNQTVIDRHGDMQPGPEIFGAHWDDGEYGCRCPYGAPGDTLWVRETWAHYQTVNHVWRSEGRAFDEVSDGLAGYRADGHDSIEDFRAHVRLMSGCDLEHVIINGDRWRPSRYMPRWASRITLRITDVRVERLQDISEDDARAEGATMRPSCNGFQRRYPGWSMDWSEVGKPSYFATGAQRGKKAPLTESDVSLGSAKWAFASFWTNIHGPGAWDENPWVWAIGFERVKP